MNTITLQSEPSPAMQMIQGEKKLAESRVTVGFDGFIDILVKPIVKTSQEPSKLQYFKTIEEFGNFLSSHKGVSCSVETQMFSKKFGGNAPLLSNALSHLGVPVDCIGTFGKDAIDPVFLDLTFPLYSFDDAGISTALEFTDGKVLLGERISKRPSWEAILACTSEAGLDKLINGSDLLRCV